MRFLEEFNKITNDKFSYIRVRKVNVNMMPPSIEIELLVPYDVLDRSLTDIDKSEIEGISKQLLPDTFDVKISYVKSYVNEEIVRRHVADFFRRYHPTMIIRPEDISVKITDGRVHNTITLNSMFYDFFSTKNVEQRLSEYLSHCFCNVTSAELIDSKENLDYHNDFSSDEMVTLISRRIKTSAHSPINGKEILTSPYYIADCKDAEDNGVYCGKVVEYKRTLSKKTNNPYYTIVIDDTTGRLCCKAFTRSDKPNAYDSIKEGQEVIVEGKVALDTFIHDKCLLINKMAYCVIDYDTVVNDVPLKEENKEYKVVFPTPYTDAVQVSIFGEEEACPECINNRDFVVFDFETTGLEPTKEKVIELGAVKVRNGVIIEGFSTFINPEKKLSKEIVNLTNITDDMVADAPIFSEVLPDFFKFTRGAAMVAHNAPFDMGFLRAESKGSGYIFENEVIDTLTLCRKYLNMSNNKLTNITKMLGIELEGAHRAVNDSAATAKLFLHIAKNYGIK